MQRSQQLREVGQPGLRMLMNMASDSPQNQVPALIHERNVFCSGKRKGGGLNGPKERSTSF